MKTSPRLRHDFLFSGSALLPVPLAFCAILATSSASAQTVWNGSVDGNWSTPGNWDGAEVPANGSSLTFSGTANQTNINDQINTGIDRIGTLTLENAGWDIDLGTLKTSTPVGMGGIVATGDSILRGTFAIGDGSPKNITLNGTAGTTTLTIAGTLGIYRANNSMTLNVNGAGNTLLVDSLSLGAGGGNKTISGTADVTVTVAVTENINGSFVKAGTGTLTLNGTYTTNSPTVVNDGTLLINGDASAATGAFTVNGGTLVLAGTASIVNTPSITLGSEGTLDVSTLTTALVMEDGQALRSSATGDEATGGALTTASTKDLTLSSGGLAFTAYGGVNGDSATDAPLTVAGVTAGELKLNAAPVTVTTTTSLAAGDYVLVAKSGSASVTGTPGTLTVDGEGTAGTPSLAVTDGQLVLTVAAGGDPYAAWANGGGTFEEDDNGDGVKNGLAFLLGAADPDANALGLLPTVTETGGGLVMNFTMLDSASRGNSTLSVEHSSDLGIFDAWTAVPVPDATPDPQASDVTFIVSGSGTLSVTATIQSTEAADGKLFGRLNASQP